MIDDRLLSSESEAQIDENFNRVLTLIDEIDNPDFSTAQVTVLEAYTASFPAITTEDDVADFPYIATGGKTVYREGVYDIVLYKGHALLITDAIVEGSAELIDEEEGIWDVTGAVSISEPK